MDDAGRQRVMEQLTIDEGKVLEVYLCSENHPTVGIGHLILKTDPEHGADVGTPITEERCEELFMKDLDIAISECEALYGDSWSGFPGEVQEILINMLFNLGRPTLSRFVNFGKALEEGDWKTAATEGLDSRWARQVGARADRLMSRLEAV